MNSKGVGLPIFIIILFFIIAAGGILLGTNSEVSDNVRNSSDLNSLDTNSPDLNNLSIMDMNASEKDKMIEDANCSGWGFFLHSENETLVQTGFGLCWVENTSGDLLRSFGLEPEHVYFGLLLILALVALISYAAAGGTSKMMWILILGVIVVGILLLFRAT